MSIDRQSCGGTKSGRGAGALREPAAASPRRPWLLRLRGRRLSGLRAGALARGFEPSWLGGRRLRRGRRLRHERAGLASPAGRDVVHRAGRGDRGVVVEQGLAQALSRLLVLVLDQQPVDPLAAGAVMLHADQDPAALEPLSLQGELEVAMTQSVFGRWLLRFPRAPVPDHDGAAAILSFGNRAFEVAVVERVVLDLDREPLVGRIGRGSARHGPGLEDAVELEPQVVMEPASRMFLDDEPERSGRRACDPPAGSGVRSKLRFAA